MSMLEMRKEITQVTLVKFYEAYSVDNILSKLNKSDIKHDGHL